MLHVVNMEPRSEACRVKLAVRAVRNSGLGLWLLRESAGGPVVRLSDWHSRSWVCSPAVPELRSGMISLSLDIANSLPDRGM